LTFIIRLLYNSPVTDAKVMISFDNTSVTHVKIGKHNPADAAAGDEQGGAAQAF